jgi:hypothetical protein
MSFLTTEIVTASSLYVDTIVVNLHIQADTMMEEIHLDTSGLAAAPTVFYSNKTLSAPLSLPLAPSRPPGKNNGPDPGNGNGRNNNWHRNTNRRNGGSGGKKNDNGGNRGSNTTVVSHGATTNGAGAHHHVPRPIAHRPHAFMATTGPYTLPGFVPGQQQQYQQAPPTPPLGWAPWNGAGWDQQSLTNSFSTMVLQPPHNSVNDWVADSGNSHHTTHSVGNISNPHPLNSANPSSIIVGNGFTLPVTSVGDSLIPGSFYLNNILLALDIVQNLLSVRRFTTDNWCSMEFDPFGLSVKDLTTRNMIAWSNSTDPLYTLCLPSFTAFSRTSPCAMSTIVVLIFGLLSPRLHGTIVLATLALTPYLACLFHPLFPALVLLMIFVMLVS